jgi:hypothetical protein
MGAEVIATYLFVLRGMGGRFRRRGTSTPMRCSASRANLIVAAGRSPDRHPGR